MNITEHTMTNVQLTVYRESLHMTEKEFAKLIGVTPQAVRLWENDKRCIPETTVRLIALFKRKPALLMEF